ncbi:MAG: hypothetical protein M5U34_38305 [Chloroflexi bacterium]|nr:hypothetical protein [Chloroflexota bacterium]
MKRSRLWIIVLSGMLTLVNNAGAQETAVSTLPVLPGDTWTALAYRYDADVQAFKPAHEPAAPTHHGP